MALGKRRDTSSVHVQRMSHLRTQQECGHLQARKSVLMRNQHSFPTRRSSDLEKEMATYSSVLAWRIPGMAEPGGLPSMGLHRVGHD